MAKGDVITFGGQAAGGGGGVKFSVPYVPGPHILINHYKERMTNSTSEVKVAEIRMNVKGSFLVTWNVFKAYYSDASNVYAHLYQNSSKIATLSVGMLAYIMDLSTTALVSVAAGDTLSIRLQASATMSCYNDVFYISAGGTPDLAEMEKYGTLLM